MWWRAQTTPMTPIMKPLLKREYSVSRPAVMPPAKVKQQTKMLFVMMAEEVCGLTLRMLSVHILCLSRSAMAFGPRCSVKNITP